MLFDSTKNLLLTMLRSLETPEKLAWDDQIESGKQCLFEMHQMSRPLYKAYRTEGVKCPGVAPVSAKVTKAIPHVKVMVSAIRRKDQATALASGKAALAEFGKYSRYFNTFGGNAVSCAAALGTPASPPCVAPIAASKTRTS
jgi:hypothetical protein